MPQVCDLDEQIMKQTPAFSLFQQLSLLQTPFVLKFNVSFLQHCKCNMYVGSLSCNFGLGYQKHWVQVAQMKASAKLYKIPQNFVLCTKNTLNF